MKYKKYAKLENDIIIEYPENKDNENCLTLDDELYQYCLSLGQVKFIGSLEDRIYTISDKELFVQCGVVIEDLGVQSPSTEDRIKALETALLEVL